MTAPAATPTGSWRLARLAREARSRREQAIERCEVCGEALPDRHRHVFDVAAGELRCACRACTILFDSDAAGGPSYRLVPERRRRLDGGFDDAVLQAAGVPVGMAFLAHSSALGQVIARYPSPAGPTETEVDADAWDRLVDALPELHSLQPDVEALLVHRARGGREHWLVPIDDCYRLVGIVRTHWRGISGGDRVWHEVDRFFDGIGGAGRQRNRG